MHSPVLAGLGGRENEEYAVAANEPFMAARQEGHMTVAKWKRSDNSQDRGSRLRSCRVLGPLGLNPGSREVAAREDRAAVALSLTAPPG